MKKIFIALLLLPLLANAQKDNSKLYGTAMLYAKVTLNLNKSSFLGGSITAGKKLSNFGIGAGAEAFKIFSNLNTAFPVYADARYFFDSKGAALHPFVAINAGKLFWNTSQYYGVAIDNTTFYYKGNGFFALEGGMRITKAQSKRGLLISAAIRRYGESHYTVHRASISPIGTPGPEVITKSTSFNQGYTDLALKVGYQF